MSLLEEMKKGWARILSSLSNDSESDAAVTDLREFEAMVQRIYALFMNADQRGVKDGAEELRLRELRDLYYDAEHVLAEHAYEGRRGFYLGGDNHKRKPEDETNQMVSFVRVPSEVATRVKEIRERFSNIICQLEALGGDDEKKEEPKKLAPCQISTLIDGSLVFGREREKKEIIDMILSDNCNNCKVTVIYIVANSGIGKTTILHLVNKEESVSDAFDRTIYVSLSMNCDEKRLIKEIIESLSYSPCDITDLETLENILMDELMDRKILLLLDDAEQENKSVYDKLLMLLNVCANGSVILATTSRMQVAEATGATWCHKLEFLSNEYCSQLFQNQIFLGHDPNVYPYLVKIGERLVRRCENNSLCIKMLSGLLRHSITEECLRAIFESDFWNMYGSGEETVLRVCYEFLPPHLKPCLAYCSLFPKNYILSKQHLVRLWLSQGLIEPMEGNDDLEDIGFLYFDELCNRSYFQHSPLHDAQEDKFVMHDLNHDLVQYFSKNECIRIENSLQNLQEVAPHFSIVPFEYQTVSLNLITNARALQSFLVINRYAFQRNKTISPILGLRGLNDLFVNSSMLRTLDLSNSSIKELPDSIALLRNLHYLGLNNTKIEAIPAEISKLNYLLTLDIKCCNYLVELPDSIEVLTNLLHLDVTKRNDFVCMPRGIRKLTNLQSLAAFNVGWSEDMHCGVGELKYLDRLKGSLCISQLENVRDKSEAREANMKTKFNLQTLSLQWSNNVAYTNDYQDPDPLFQQEVLEALQPNHTIQELIIRNYAGNKFPLWVGDPSFSKLVSIVLDCCPNCNELPACGELPSLRYLSLQKFYGIKRIEASKFPLLESLKLWEMYDLKDWVDIRDGDFPFLHSLSVKRCPLLRTLPRFPSLVELAILYCSQLSEIPDLPSLESLKIEGLERIERLNLPQNRILLKKLEITRCSELSSLDGLSKITTLKKLKITQCPKLDVGNWRPNRFSQLAQDSQLVEDSRIVTKSFMFFKDESSMDITGTGCYHADQHSTNRARFIGPGRQLHVPSFSRNLETLLDPQTEQIFSKFLSKALHTILSARITHTDDYSTTVTPSKQRPYNALDNRWFHLALDDLPTALDNPSSFPRGVTELLIVDVLLSPRDDPSFRGTIIERWVVQCGIPMPLAALHSPAAYSFKSFIVLLRSIYSVLRMLPTQRIFKMLRASSYNYKLSYKISSFAEPFSQEVESELRTHCFVPVETQSGKVAVSVQYRPCLSSFHPRLLKISSSAPASAPLFHTEQLTTVPTGFNRPSTRNFGLSLDEYSDIISLSPKPSI